MTRYGCALIALLLWASPVWAQTTTGRLAWDQPLTAGHTFADAQAYTFSLKVDTGAATLVTATCTNGTPIKCTTPLPSLSSGAHTLTLTATNAFGSASSQLQGSPPSSPINLTVTVTVTVP